MDSGTLANYMKYSYKYDDQKRMTESETMKWNSQNNTWENDLRICYAYQGKSITTTYYKWNSKQKAYDSFVSTPNPYPIMSRVTSEEASELLSENKALRRRLEEALLRLEGYEIMGDILQEEYGIDLLKKSAAGQSSVSKKDTQQ